MGVLSSQMAAYVCKTKNIIYRTAMQKSIGIGQKVLYINGKKTLLRKIRMALNTAKE